MTHIGHILTTKILRLPYDATGALRLYRLDRIPQEYFFLVKSIHYAFFFESLAILDSNGLRITEVPINLPARVYGHSKMQVRHIIGVVKRSFRGSVLFRFPVGVPFLLRPCRIEACLGRSAALLSGAGRSQGDPESGQAQ
jgi:hypothetical protein